MSRSCAPALLFAAVFAGCSDGVGVPPGGSGPALVEDIGSLPVFDPAEFVAGVAHPFFPMAPGARWVYAGDEEGTAVREEVQVAAEPESVLGVACTVLIQEVFHDGERVEVTTHWFAEDVAGNLWRFGERTVQLGALEPSIGPDSWRAGDDGALPWVVLGVDPQPGDLHLGGHPGGLDEVRVVARDLTESVPAGTFDGCVVTEESDPEDPEDVDQIIYAPGVGPVSETSATVRLALIP